MMLSSAAVDSKLALRRLNTITARLERSDDRWFDGTPGSIDRRLAQVDNALVFVRGTVARIGSTEAGIRCADVLPRLEQARRGLVALRDDLFTGTSARRGDDEPYAGRRTANRHAVVAAAHSDFPDELMF
jgi:hypothetical protein